METVAGVDGCPGGWVAAVWGDDGVTWRALPLAFGDLLAGLADCAVVAVDVPIGMPETGKRACDLAARAALGGGAARVFMTPHLGSHPGCDRDSLVREAQPDCALVVEAHPELSFLRMTGRVLPSKRSGPGPADRLDALACAPRARRHRDKAGRAQAVSHPRLRRRTLASNFQCIGLDPEDEAAFERLVERLVAESAPLGTAGDLRVLRWEDPSGARVLFGLRGNEIVDLLPSYAAEPGVRFADLSRLNDDMLSGDVVDEDGEQITSMTVGVEEHRLLDLDPRPWSGLAAVTAFGAQVTVHADADAFGTSDASLLNPEMKDEPPPPDFDSNARWPLRLAAESFISMGLFAGQENADATALLAGTVLRAERRRNTLSGLDFVVARVSSFGSEVAVCLSAAEHDVPAPGNVVSGTVFVVASTGVTAEPPRRGLSRVLRRRG